MLRSRGFGNLGHEKATCCMICISCKDSGFCKLSVHMLTKVTPGQCQGEHEVARPVCPGCLGLGANQGIVFCGTDSPHGSKSSRDSIKFAISFAPAVMKRLQRLIDAASTSAINGPILARQSKIHGSVPAPCPSNRSRRCTRQIRPIFHILIKIPSHSV